MLPIDSVETCALSVVISSVNAPTPWEPKPLTYCQKCVLPSSRPTVSFDSDGVCDACRYLAQRPTIDWDRRKAELETILARYRNADASHYDCIVPVSGGKDSTYQVVTMLEMDMTPLCVCASTCMLTDLGRKNLDNLRDLGVDLIEFSTNPVVRRKMNRIGLEEVGDISWPEHVSIFTIPVRVAVQHNIPLIIWGENSQYEYGGPAADAYNNTLTRRWLEEYGGLLGLSLDDFVGKYGIRRRDLIPFQYPSDEDLERVGVTGLFIGHYIPWNGEYNADFAKAHGFAPYHTFVEGSSVDYENLDNAHTGIHDYFKFLKLGFGRATDMACLDVRFGRKTREDALAIVREHDGKFPWTYLGHSLEDILAEMDMTVEDFIAICDRFTNRSIFLHDENGHLQRDAHGNLTKINYDNI